VTQTFDIRFARTAGLAAMLEVPENAFRWKGGGLLRIDAHGISIGLKRSLLALFGGKRMQRIPTANLRAVYREGDALRVEFQSGESARVVLPFWADNRDTAAQIVRLLPTSQTVEIEHSTDATHSGRSRADWPMLLSAGVALAAIMVGTWAVYQRANLDGAVTPAPVSDRATSGEVSAPLPMPDATAALVERPDSPVSEVIPPVNPVVAAPQALDAEATATPDFLEPPATVLVPPGSLPLPRDYVRSEDFVIPIARGTAAYDVAKRELPAFEREATQLESGYRLQRDLLDSGAITAEEFAAKLDEYEMRWWDLTFRIFDNDSLADSRLLDLRASMLATARLWRSFLTAYAKGLRARDHRMIANSFDELARAQEMQSRARLFLR
jgi:hypothetical protein